MTTELSSTEIKLNKALHEISMLRAERWGNRGGMKVFALGCSSDFGRAVCKNLNISLSPIIERYHNDGEVYVRPGENVRRSTVFVICSLYGDQEESVNDKLAKVKYFVGALKDAAASEITLVAPYLAYSRSDRKVKSREPVITKYLARELEVVGVNRLITMDVHSLQAYQNAFAECRTDNLTCKVEFAEFFATKFANIHPSEIGVLSPDAGGFPRTEEFRKALTHRLGKGIGIAFLDKRHDEDDSNQKYAETIVGPVRPYMIVLDDIIASGGTIALSASAACRGGAKQVWCAATHGLFVGKVNDLLDTKDIYRIVVSDAISPFRLSEKLLQKTEIVATDRLWAEAIRRTFTGDSLSSMFRD